MNQKNLSAQNKTHKQILSFLKNRKISEVYSEFSSSLNARENLAVAVSGGPDSLALAYLAKCYSIKNKVTVKFFLVDHKLRTESTKESASVKKILQKIGITCKVLSWKGKKPIRNIQSLAREARYSLLSKECKKNNIKHLLLGHHSNDLFENFLIRVVRGSGLNGLVSFNKSVKYKDENLNILRPLLNLEKNDLINISKVVFKYFIKDPSNINKIYKRTRIRTLLESLEKEGLDLKKLRLTIDNLRDSDKSIKFYVEKNLKYNSVHIKKKDTYILNYNFFDQSHEVVFRSLTLIIQKVGKKYYPVRGKSINELINRITLKTFSKITLGGCFVESVNETILITRENLNKVKVL
ncbi:tRNA lysidine(34) synthetase TilS [Candidatus Pelagibacter sp. Uisw_099_02]|uniref:tRNA lysidine(34) synthetase TilS n=1 Tax=Candidatus Pelagibacter sp. Uisw_099_02 TaxID=3230981 RepID=UPI0039EBB373